MTADLAISKIQSEFSTLLGTTSKSRHSLIKLAGDISTRRYYRIQSETQQFILQQADAFNSEDKNFFILAQKIFSTCGIPVPKILETRPELGLILMEDLGDRMLQEDPQLTFYQEAIDHLVKWTRLGHLHLMPEELKLAPHFQQAFDIEKLEFEMQHTDSHLFEKLLTQKKGTFFRLTLHNNAFLDARPRFLCHRDYHSRNIMLHKDHTFVIDFQDARMGPITYDLVSLLWDPYAQLENSFQTTLLEKWKRAVFDKNSDAIVKALLEDAQTDFEEELHRMKIQRLLKAAGSYASFFNTRGRRDYLHCVEYAIKQSRDSLDWLVSHKRAHQLDADLLAFLSSQKFTDLGTS